MKQNNISEIFNSDNVYANKITSELRRAIRKAGAAVTLEKLQDYSEKLGVDTLGLDRLSAKFTSGDDDKPSDKQSNAVPPAVIGAIIAVIVVLAIGASVGYFLYMNPKSIRYMRVPTRTRGRSIELATSPTAIGTSNLESRSDKD